MLAILPTKCRVVKYANSYWVAIKKATRRWLFWVCLLAYTKFNVTSILPRVALE